MYSNVKRYLGFYKSNDLLDSHSIVSIKMQGIHTQIKSILNLLILKQSGSSKDNIKNLFMHLIIHIQQGNST